MKQLVQRVLAETTNSESSIHGPRHWARVERNGLYLSQFCSADPQLVSLFALFHDSMRHNDGHDPQHGARAADYIQLLRTESNSAGESSTVAVIAGLPDEDFDTLCYACRWHTLGNDVLNETIGACWDADRLDLGRVGIQPDSSYLSIPESKRIADTRDWRCLETFGSPATSLLDGTH